MLKEDFQAEVISNTPHKRIISCVFSIQYCLFEKVNHIFNNFAKTFKKISAAVMAVTSLAVNMVGINANAANIEDTDIDNFSAPPSISNTYLAVPEDENGVRVKDNNSSVYLYITSSPYNLFVQTWGLSDANWSSSTANRTCNANGASTTHVTVTPGRRYVIKNLINERGDRCAGLKFCSSSYYNYAAIKGKWSPDFSGNPNLNVTVAN